MAPESERANTDEFEIRLKENKRTLKALDVLLVSLAMEADRCGANRYAEAYRLLRTKVKQVRLKAGRGPR